MSEAEIRSEIVRLHERIAHLEVRFEDLSRHVFGK